MTETLSTTGQTPTPPAPEAAASQAAASGYAALPIVAQWRAQRTAVPWYGLDDAWTGDRWLSTLIPGPDGVAEYGTLGHGDRPARRPDEAAPRKFCGVVTMAKLGRRPAEGSAAPATASAGAGAGAASGASAAAARSGAFLEPTTLHTLAAVAGLGLLADDWPWTVDKALRGEWLAQQTEVAYEVAEDLDAMPWRSVQLPVDGRPTRFCYRESEYGWVLAAELRECWLGAYGRGLTAYGLGFAQVTLDTWDLYPAL